MSTHARVGPKLVGSYNLADEDDVNRLAQDLGKTFNETVVAVVRHLTPEQQVVFYGFLFAAPFGGMLAALGLPACNALISSMQSLNERVQSIADAPKH